MSCLHPGFTVAHRVRRVNEEGREDLPAEAIYLEVKAWCSVCQTPMQFAGVAFGLSPDKPTKDGTGTEVTLPMLPLHLQQGDASTVPSPGGSSLKVD